MHADSRGTHDFQESRQDAVVIVDRRKHIFWILERQQRLPGCYVDVQRRAVFEQTPCQSPRQPREVESVRIVGCNELAFTQGEGVPVVRGGVEGASVVADAVVVPSQGGRVVSVVKELRVQEDRHFDVLVEGEGGQVLLLDAVVERCELSTQGGVFDEVVGVSCQSYACDVSRSEEVWKTDDSSARAFP